MGSGITPKHITQRVKRNDGRVDNLNRDIKQKIQATQGEIIERKEIFHNKYIPNKSMRVAFRGTI